jgi:APA family basic amino acid/polyamine antiporter
VATGLVPYTELKAADPLAKALDVAGLKTAGWIVSFGAVVSLSAVLLVFQYGQPRILFAMARDGLLPPWASRVSKKRRVPHITTFVTGLVVGLGALVADENEIYDLTNIGTLSAFAIVCLGVLVLRYLEPSRPRPFRVPFVWPVTLIGATACVYTMFGLPRTAWERFGIWLVIGSLVYFGYSVRHSKLRKSVES